MSDAGTQTTPTGTGEKHTTFTLSFDEAAIEELLKNSSASNEDKQAAKSSGSASHKLTADLSNLTWMEFTNKVGTTSFIPDLKVTLTPENGQSPLQLDLHADLIKEKWADFGSVSLTSGLGGDLDYKDGNGVSGKLDVSQAIKFKKATFEADIKTDFSTPSPQTTFSGKFSYEF